MVHPTQCLHFFIKKKLQLKRIERLGWIITSGREVVEDVGEFQGTVTDADGRGGNMGMRYVRDSWCFCLSSRVSFHHSGSSFSRQRGQRSTDENNHQKKWK